MAGYKTFTIGETLDASEVNGYLMTQSVMVFADDGARTTALTSVLAEGMVSYLTSLDTMYVYTGAAWVAIATIDDVNALSSRDALVTFYMEVI